MSRTHKRASTHTQTHIEAAPRCALYLRCGVIQLLKAAGESGMQTPGAEPTDGRHRTHAHVHAHAHDIRERANIDTNDGHATSSRYARNYARARALPGNIHAFTHI